MEKAFLISLDARTPPPDSAGDINGTVSHWPAVGVAARQSKLTQTSVMGKEPRSKHGQNNVFLRVPLPSISLEQASEPTPVQGHIRSMRICVFLGFLILRILRRSYVRPINKTVEAFSGLKALL